MTERSRGRLQDKRTVVVGAGSGIGRAVVERFRAEGATVAALEIDSSKADALRSVTDPDLVVCGTATSWTATAAVVDALVQRCGGVDVLVNCVGRYDFNRGIRDLTPQQIDAGFDEAFDVNVRSHLVSVKTALPHLQASAGSVILTVSTSGFVSGRGGLLYVASKFALRGAVLALAAELAPAVRVNGVAPGGTDGTDLSGLASLGLDHRSMADDPNRGASIAARVPLRSATTAHDVAGSFVFLASDDARTLSGTFVHPDGGVQAG